MRVKITRNTLIRLLTEYPFLWLATLLGIFPLYWLISNSLKTEAALFANPLAPPSWPVVTGNWLNAWAGGPVNTPLIRPLLNSIGLTFSAVALILIISSAAGYAFSRFQIYGGNLIFSFIIMGLSVPIHATLVPLVVLYNFIGILDTYFALLLTFVAVNLPFSVLLMRAYFVSIPEEIAESARIDGASEVRTFWSIMLPVARPGLITMAIMNFLFVWNDFLYSYTLVSSREFWTLPRAVYAFVGVYGLFSFTSLLAGMAIAVAPTLIIYFIFSKQLISGIAAGALKG